MTPAQQQLIDSFRSRFGQRVALTDPADVEPWLTDWRGRWTGSSAAILQPDSTEGVAMAVRLGNELNVPLVPQGGNTSMVGGATPPADGSALILSLRRMNRFRSIDREARRCVVEAGVILQTLHDALADEGMRFPLTLGAKGSATIGGLVSTNAGGTQVLRFGPMRGLVDGIEAVLPNGMIHNGLAGLKKDNRGPSLDQLLIGAEGTLGVVTAARLKLVPAIHSRSVAWLGLDNPQTALNVLRELERATDRIEGFEILPDESLQAALQHLSGARPPLESAHGWHALVEATASSAQDEAPDTLLARLLAPMIERGMIGDAVLSANEAQAESFWRIRDGLSESEKKAFGPATQHDISVPVEAMPRFLEKASAKLEHAFPGASASGFGHLGDGNIHFHVRAMGRGGEDWLEREGEAVSRMVHDLVTAAGGSISAEHGIGQMKRDELARLSPDRVSALKAIKAGLDPKGLMNPGKLV
ncbi:FAD-binding oxidoreductase [Sphingomonas sp. HDW15A]|uniref:FAD-binding oxidoreductase n=1 Tax=Sphingomonas sp. HDW15A TaxID=2714942 RepID=UPI00140DA5F4|nr:FAD-binding oxidoreductase [Sphingomonas sp. HDW15A]QIK96507.1 FAD-binding oxidoreductase [Sphingomonas sp. HDW15A]